MNMSESIKEIAPALLKFNAEVSRISKDATNPFHKNKYSTLDQIIEEIRPTLQKHGLTIMQNASGNEGNITVKTFLLHESGEWMESDGVTLRPQKQDPQGYGGGVTYARRYDLCAFLSLNTGEDDDGNSASGLDKNKKDTKKKENKYEPQNDPLNNDMMAKVSQATRNFNSKDELFKHIGTDSDQMNTIYKTNKAKDKKDMIKKLEDVINDYANAG